MRRAHAGAPAPAPPAAATQQAFTIAACLRIRGARTTGFDYLRILLAASIILWHGIVVSYGADTQRVYWHTPVGHAFACVLPMFFALSGFLVTGSLERCRTLVSFFALRTLRIIPALAVEITLSALVLGPLLTRLGWRDYFSSAEFRGYFLNILGDIHYVLPGLFADNPLPRIVNGQLWTVPYELQCYLVLGGLAAVALLRFRWAILAIAACGQMLWAAQAVKLAHSDPSRPPAATGALLLIAFLCGNLGYMFRDRIVLSWPIFGLCVLVSCVLAGLPSGGLYLAFPVAYITVFLGLLNPPGNRFLASGDYSYGLFLYGFPIQQAVAHIWPATHFWLANVAIAFPAALLFAFVSWHTVEKPALALRRFVPAVETRLIRLFGRKASSAPAGSGAAAPRSRIAAGCMIVAVLGGVLALVDGQDLAGVAALLAAFAVLVLAGRMTQPR